MLSIATAIADGLDPDSGIPEEELEELKLARTRMRYYIPFTFPQYKADIFHLNVCDAIDQIVTGDLTHLMLFAPPQTGKSEIVSTRLPGFWLAHHPDLPILLTSYGDGLALRNSRNSMAVVESPHYDRLFRPWGVMRDEDHWRIKDWHILGEKGKVIPAGMGGRVTGEGFGLCIVDDPIKDWAEAQSELIREKLWDWWRGTLLTRLWENHRIVFMMTRWHEDDLAARVLKNDGNLNVCMDCGKYIPHDRKPEMCPKCGGPRGKWKTLSFSATCETQDDRDLGNKSLGLPDGLPDLLGRTTGISVAPSRFTAKFYYKLKFEVGDLVWNAEYQQHPSPPKGDMFKVGRIEIVDAYPLESFGGQLINQASRESKRQDLTIVGAKNCIRFWDLAATEQTDPGDPDWTIGALLGLEKGTNITWCLNIIRIRGTPENVQEMVKSTAMIDGKRVKIRIEQEPGAAGKKVINDYKRVLVGYDVEGVPATGEKSVRATPLSIQVNAGNVRMLEADWNTPTMAVLRVFPHGKHDDDVDAMSGSFNELTEPSDFKGIKFKHLKRGKTV